MKLRYKLSLLLICLMLIGCLYVTQSYALWIVTEEQTNENEVEVGCFSIGFSEQSNSINLNNTYPMSDSLGLSSDPYTFTITNTCTINNSYVLTLNTLSTNTLDVSKIKYALYKSTEEKPTVGSKLSRINTDLENLGVENLGTSYILDTGVLTGGTKVDGEVSKGEEATYNLYLWIDDIAGNEVEGQSFEASINITSVAMDDDKMPAEEYIKRLSTVESGDGLYKVEHNDLKELGQEWNKTEYRFGGANPNNYVRFNNEIWRIIGLVNVKMKNGIEQRVKIIRQDGIKSQKNFGSYSWDRLSSYTNSWATSKLKDMLNGIYYGSETGECYKNGKAIMCDFNSGTELPKGLDETTRSMIDKEVIWNLGGNSTYVDVTVKAFYEKERGTTVFNNRPIEWSKETDVGEKYNGIGLIYPSDYGYATNGGSIGRENCFAEYLYNWDKTVNAINYQSECGGTDWLKPSSGDLWTLSSISSTFGSLFGVSSSGYVFNGYNGADNAISVWPTVYLSKSLKITENSKTDLEYGTIDNPFVLEN